MAKMSEPKDIIGFYSLHIVRHIFRVREYLSQFQKMLHKRGLEHDLSKLDKEEMPYFEKYAPFLKSCKYGSEEYKKFLQELSPALERHYKNNRHHPEHFENGLAGMNLLDLCEIFCDWIAAGEQHKDGGNIFRSIEINQERFGYGDEVKSTLVNTAGIFKKE